MRNKKSAWNTIEISSSLSDLKNKNCQSFYVGKKISCTKFYSGNEKKNAN
jgi:hypothetical protein